MKKKIENPFANMRKVAVGMLCMLSIGLAGCVKQGKCDCGLTGKFVYFEEPEEIIYCGYETKVNAVFIQNDVEYRYIISTIPNKFRTKDTVNVSVCLKEEPKEICLAFGLSTVYKLKCIEKED